MTAPSPDHILSETPSGLAPPPHPFNLAAHALARADALAGKTALAIVSPQGAERWRYGQLLRTVQGIATGLLSEGLSPGDRVLMRLGNEVEFPLAYLGAIWAGLVPVPTSSQLTTPEISRIAADLQPRLTIAAPGIALPVPAPCPVILDSALRKMASRPAAPPDMGDPDRPGYIVYTSGTSGRPRGVVHAHRALWARRSMVEGWYGLTASDRLLHAGAFNWTYTLGTGLLDPWAIGATALIPAAGTNAAQLPLLLKRFDATIFAAAPGVYRQMLRDVDRLDVPKLRHGLSAGEALPEVTRTAWAAATGRPVHEALGMSECSTFVSGSPERPAPNGTTGFPQSGRRVAVLGADGTAVRRGTPGTLAIHRSDPGLMLGYLDAPAETEARFAGDWFLTGDSVAMADDGALTYLGRNDDMMNAGGYRVSPLEVEAALSAHPGIAEVACAEVAVKSGVTVIAAFYTGAAPVPDDALAAFVAGRLARYKCPRIFEHVAELPRSGNGKLNRQALRRTAPPRTPPDRS
ncbi:MAG: class I adenylate-forming enzyme family protein [Pseudomonadota bacterium]